jgi:hypothetical protein
MDVIQVAGLRAQVLDRQPAATLAAPHRPVLSGTDGRGAASSPTILGAGTGVRLGRGFEMPLTATASGGMTTPARVPSCRLTKVNRCLTEGRRALRRRATAIEAGEECERLAPLLAQAVGHLAKVDDRGE